MQDNTGRIKPADILLVCTFRNEQIRLPYFLKYYRDLGVAHFLFIDNGSEDGAAGVSGGHAGRVAVAHHSKL